MVPACETSQQPGEGELVKDTSLDKGLEEEAPHDSDSHEAPQTEKGGLTSTEECNSSSTHHDEFEVWWNEPADQDPDNPMNWSPVHKASIVGLVAFVAFLTPLASSMFAPGIPELLVDFDVHSDVLATFVVSIYILGFAVGPLLVGPLSEMKGRSFVYHTCNFLFVVFTVCSALSVNMGMLMVFRFLSGFAGVASTTIGSGTIADMIPVQDRGFYMALWSLGPVFGPVVGPIAGGFLMEKTNWRWTFWVISMAGGIVMVACWFILKETFETTILEKKAKKLRKETGNPAWHPRKPPGKTKTQAQLWQETLIRPMKILLFSPIASFMCVYIAVLYGLLYLLFTTFTFVFQGQYGFDTRAAGLSYLGSGVGTLLGLFYTMKMGDRLVRKRIKQGIRPIPEDRLPYDMVIPGVLLIPAGLFIYGWGAEKQVHWIVPQIGNAVLSYGSNLIIMCILTYLTDAYGIYAASAVAAAAVLRNLAGAFLPLCGLQLYDALGFGWGNSLLAFIALGLAPIPVLFRIFGAKLRESHVKKLLDNGKV